MSHHMYHTTRYRLERSKKKEAIENAHKVIDMLLRQPGLGNSINYKIFQGGGLDQEGDD